MGSSLAILTQRISLLSLEDEVNVTLVTVNYSLAVLKL